MKLLLLTSIAFIATLPLFAQRNCGTMQNLEYLKSQDPSLEERQKQAEQLIQKCIKDHPVGEKKINFPLIKDFTPTGNSEKDREAYAKAKQSLYQNDPAGYRKLVGTSTTYYRQPVQSGKKRQHTSFQPVKSN